MALPITRPTPAIHAILTRRRSKTPPTAPTPAQARQPTVMPEALRRFLATLPTPYRPTIEGWQATTADGDDRPHIEVRLAPTTQDLATTALLRIGAERMGGQLDLDHPDRIAITYLAPDDEAGAWLTFWHPTR